MKKIIYFVIAGFTLAACSPMVNVVSDYDQSVNFEQYETYEIYGWSDETDIMLNRFDKQRILDALEEEFQARGIRQVDSGADLLVSLIVVVEEETQTRAYTTFDQPGYRYYGNYYGYGPGYPWGPGYATTTLRGYDYHVGTLVIDVFDAQQEILVWEGAGSRVIDEDPVRREGAIPGAVSKIMDKFPVKEQ